MVDPKQFSGLEDLKKDIPKQLYVRGVWPKCDRGKIVSVIGSRKMSGYGEQVIRKLVPELVQNGAVIVSGLMYGVDKLVHRTCLEHGGVTVAVLGWGIDERMNPDDEALCREIIAGGGAIVSEWKTQSGTKWTFPRRDRVVAALSSKIYVVEAAEKSGTLITAEWGIKMEREIWAVPGPVASRVSVGTNKLIADGRAKIWAPKVSVTS